MSESEKRQAGKLAAAIVTLLAVTGAAVGGAEERGAMERSRFLVMDHMGGRLALSAKSLTGVFYGGAAGQPARLRLNLAGGDSQTVEAPQAEALWKELREGESAASFLWVEHLGGTLGIPIAAIESLWLGGTADAPTLRIRWPGDAQGKVVTGPEARRIWERLAGKP